MYSIAVSYGNCGQRPGILMAIIVPPVSLHGAYMTLLYNARISNGLSLKFSIGLSFVTNISVTSALIL